MYPSLASDPERQTAWQHRRWPLSHVHQKEGSSHRPGHWGAYLSLEGNTEGKSQYCHFSADKQVSGWQMSSLSSSSLGQIPRHLWCLGVQVASSPALPTERDSAISSGGHHANISSPGCHGVSPTCLYCGTWSQGVHSSAYCIVLFSARRLSENPD